MDWWARYIGLPFQDGGRGPHAFDCWGLVRDVYARELGVALPSYGEISARDLVAVAHAMHGGREDAWREVSSPAPFDVVGMRAGIGGRRLVHVGVMVDGQRLLHVEAATAAAVVPTRHLTVAGRIIGHWRRV